MKIHPVTQPTSLFKVIHDCVCVYLLQDTQSTAPSPPSGESVSQNGLNSLLVSWTSGEPAVTGYIISYQPQDGGHSGSVNIDENVTSTIITGLMTGATYSITIVATSNTLPSTEITAPDITIGTGTNSACILNYKLN